MVRYVCPLATTTTTTTQTKQNQGCSTSRELRPSCSGMAPPGLAHHAKLFRGWGVRVGSL